jgi:glycosyltransferase involved in cell wall biosynthesis
MNSLNEYGFHLARELASNSEVSEVVVIADKLTKSLPELELSENISVKRIWSFNRLLSFFQLLRAIREAKVDGVVWNLQTATFGDREVPAALGLCLPALTRLMGTPSGIIAHNIVAGVDLENTHLKGQRLRQTVVRLGGAIVTRAMLAADYMTVTLSSYERILRTAFPSAEVHLVPHGTFDTKVRDIAKIATRPMRVVTMGKFGTYKRLETLLKAFDVLRTNPTFAKYELVIGGTDHPNTQGYLNTLAKKRCNDAGVVFKGYIAEVDVPEFFETARASVFDYSSTTGSSGVLHQTANYCTVPVFPSIGDFVDVSRDEGLTGANYTVDDPIDMARAMKDVLGDLERSQDTADANRRASLTMPLSEVAHFHVSRLKEARRRSIFGRIPSAQRDYPKG